MRVGEGYRQKGLTYVGLLAILAVSGVGLAAMGTLWFAEAQRERERDLLRVGQVYARAIASYYHATPGSVKRLPPSVDALLVDGRFGSVVRHLRQAYVDPIEPGRPWGLLRSEDGSLRGVYSLSEVRPLRQEPLELEGQMLLPVAAHYRDWKFVPVLEQRNQ